MRGQSTVELLIILAILLVILSVSVGIFSQRMNSANAFHLMHLAQRNGEIMGEAVSRMMIAPIGTSMRVFTIPSSENQQIRVLKRNVIVTTPSTTIFVPLAGDSNADVTLTPGGNIQLQRTASGIVFST